MGTRGPAPKRSDRKLGHTSKADKAGMHVSKADGAPAVDVPEADPEWHPVAKLWFSSLAESGQSKFYEPSDWATAYVLAESISRELHPQGVVFQGEVVSYEPMAPKAGAISAWLKGMSDLMVTEGARRRAAIELQRPQPADEAQPADVTSLASWKAGMGA